MSIAHAEREVFGQAFDPAERVVLGIAGAITVCGHAALGLAALAYFYALLAPLV